MRLFAIITAILLSCNLGAQVGLGLDILHFGFEDFWNEDGTSIHDEVRLDSTIITKGNYCHGYSFNYENCQLVEIIHNNKGMWQDIFEEECIGDIDGGNSALSYEDGRVVSTTAKAFNFSEAYESTNSYEYDSLGRETLYVYTRESSLETPTSDVRHSKRTKYNSDGKISSITYDRGSPEYFQYDSLCNLISSYRHSEYSDWYEKIIRDRYSFYTYPPNSVISTDSIHTLRIGDIGAPIQDTTYTTTIVRIEQVFDDEGRVIRISSEITANGELVLNELAETSYTITNDGRTKGQIKYCVIDSLLLEESMIWHYNSEDLLVKYQEYDFTDNSGLVNEVIWQYNSYGLPILKQSETETCEYFYAYKVDDNPDGCDEYSSTAGVEKAPTILALMPNPSQSSFAIESEDGLSKTASLHVYSLDGRVVYNHSFSDATTYHFEFGDELESGTYFAVLYDKGQVVSIQKLLKL